MRQTKLGTDSPGETLTNFGEAAFPTAAACTPNCTRAIPDFSRSLATKVGEPGAAETPWGQQGRAEPPRSRKSQEGKPNQGHQAFLW